jgi:hypothetical protein
MHTLILASVMVMAESSICGTATPSRKELEKVPSFEKIHFQLLSVSKRSLRPCYRQLQTYPNCNNPVFLF